MAPWRASSLGVLAFALAGCAAAPAPTALFDAHVHLNNPAMQLALMDEYGVGRAVVFWGRLSDNESVLAEAAKHPGRFVPFASISPERTAYRAQWQRDDPAIVERLARLLATGQYRGIGEINVVHDASAGFAATDFPLDSTVMRGIMDLARMHRVPVMFHCESARTADLERVLEGWRDVNVIWAHGGYTQLPEARRMLERHPNLFYELSARTWPRHPRSAEYPIVREGAVMPEWLALVESMPRRFLVGTDASHRDEASERMKIESVRGFLGRLSPTARAEVGGEVLRRLIGELTRVEALERISSADAARRRESVARLGDVGAMEDAKALVKALRDPDEETRSGAEESLWKIWARSGDEKVDALYRQGIRQMNEGLGNDAVATFSRIIEMKPAFAEAWNKRATIYFLMGEHRKSLADCDEVMKRNPDHFGALAGYFQIYVQLEDFERALRYGRRALEVNPNMEGVKNGVEAIERMLGKKQRMA